MLVIDLSVHGAAKKFPPKLMTNEASPRVNRRSFSKATLLASAALASGSVSLLGQDTPKKIRTGVIGCGSVSNSYLPLLKESPFVELVSVCDRRFERAEIQSRRFAVTNAYPSLEAMLKGPSFDFLINLTDMQEHEAINRHALSSGLHVWSEKPIANSLAAGQDLLRLAQEKSLKLWGAPITVQSPQFSFMAQQIQKGKLGRIAAAHADYGHEGPSWSAFFYEKLGGSMPDLAVYNFTTLTGLLGPALRVTALLSIVTPQRKVDDKGCIQVTEEDNAMVLLDHGQGILSHVQSGFNYFNPHGHDGAHETRHTVSVVGSHGYMGMVGYDWAPLGVDFATRDTPELKRYETHSGGYLWQQGAVLAAESLVTGKPLLVTPEHALHVLEIITAARESAATGRRMDLTSTFTWPIKGSA